MAEAHEIESNVNPTSCLRMLFGAINFSLIILFPNFASAGTYFDDVRNERDIFEPFPACEDYSNFLLGLDVDISEISEECHRLIAFLIQFKDLSDDEFIVEIERLAGGRNQLVPIARVVGFSQGGDIDDLFYILELTKRQISISRASELDVERASVYGHLLSGIQLRLVKGICNQTFQCSSLASVTSMSRMLGKNFSNLDDLDGFRMLMCLLRTDAYSVPIRQVLSSIRFNSCLARR